MESLDLELELNALHYNSHFDPAFDSAKEIDEFSERIIERSKPKPAKIKRDHKAAKLYPKVRVEGNVVVKSYKRD